MNALELEITQLHAFFENWFAGRLANDDGSFSRFETVLAPDFTMVTPDGRHSSRAAVLEAVRSAHGSGGRNIRVERIEMLDSTGDRLTAAYEEWQEVDGRTTARCSTVVFAVDFNAPNALRWLRVHETWMDPKPSTAG